MPIQMVCDSTPSLVSAAIRDALHSTSGTTNGRTVGLGYGAASTSNGVTVNGTGTASGQSPGKQQLPFRRTLAAAQLDNDCDQYDEPEDGGPNDLVESISQSLRQGQQVKPIAYEEGPSYSTSLEHLRSKYIVLKAATPTDSATSGGSLSNSNSSASFGAAGLSKATAAGGVPNTHLTMNGSGSLKFSANSSPSPNAAKSSTNVLQQQQNGVPASASTTAAGRMDTANTTLPTPKRTLFPRENVQIGWKTTGRKWLVGAGMMNMGNTCYLNSTLQALFHVPAIANWLLSDEPHRVKCDDGGSGGSCIICAMAKTLLESQTNQTAFRPYLVYSRLRLVCKHLVPGRQEDAHEFLRYLVEAMEKSYINRSKNSKELDQYSKETTPLNQILGGYLRSEVKCLSCQHVSTTFQHFEDLLLDIRKANSIDEALEVYFARERLEEMGYKCEACKRRVAATKQFSLERAPFVLCIQLKRFSMLSGKINKHVELRSKLDLTPYSSPAMRTNGGKLSYRLTSMVTHLGSTQHCGHYTAIGHTDAAGYHVFDDNSVRPIGIQNVMNTNAYILFYELESVAAGAIGLPNGTCRAKATVTVGQPSSTATLTSMGHLSNGTTATAGLGSSGGTASGTSGTGGGGGGSGGTPGKVTNSSPLRVLGTGGGNGSTGGLFPSKLEQKPGLIGPVLPTATTSTTGNSPSATVTTTVITGKGASSGPSAGGPTTTTSVTSSASASGRDIAIFSSPSSTASTLSNASSYSSPAKQHSESLSGSKVPKLPDINARHTTTSHNGALHGEAKVKSLSTPLLASMPKLNSPSKPSESTNGCSSAVISLVPYDSDDTSSTSEDEDNQEHSKSTPKSLILTNGSSTGKRARQQLVPFANGKRSAKHSKDGAHSEANDEDGNEEEEEEERTSTGSSRSPQMIKTKAGLWKVSKSSTADQLSYPDSGSASSSKSSSPATSGVSSPTSSPGQKPQKLPLKIVGTSGGGGGGEPSSMSNGHRPVHNGINGKINKSMANGYHANGAAAGNRSASPGGDGKGSASAVQMLMKYSHRGYGAPVKSWNGQQTAMERELANDRREERKRQIEEDRETEMDRGRIKKTKGGGGPPAVSGANSGGNPFQQYQNHQPSNSGGGKWMGNGGGNRNHFHNNHQNNYRGGGGGGGGYYQNGNGNRHHGGGGGANGGFRTGGRRFGGRNGGGFHTKAHHHHQRSEQGSGMASGGGGSNGFYHR